MGNQLFRRFHQPWQLSPPRVAIKCYRRVCGLPGDPNYLLMMIHEHKARKVCYWRRMAGLKRLRPRLRRDSGEIADQVSVD